VGLLEKSLKKTGTERKKSPSAIPDKVSVGWLGRTFSERAQPLADKVDLESQYARLEALSQNPVAPPKQSLRERARRFLTGAVVQRASVPEKPPREKMSLRERAALLIKKMGGGGNGGGSTASSSTHGDTPGPSAKDESHRARIADESRQALEDENFLQPNFFPWWNHSEDGLESAVAFGEEAHVASLETIGAASPQVVLAERASPVAETASPQSGLSEFAQTMERITENLKDLTVQLDRGQILHERQHSAVTSTYTPAPPPLVSHHVPLAEEAAVASGVHGVQIQQAAEEKPQDVFWPKALPLDLPARDVKLNADGSLSVVPGPFRLPYLAAEIAPPNSELSHFTKNLENAELFIAEGELQLTRIIYESLLKKVIDAEAKRKIRENLAALDNYRKSHDWGNFMPLPPWLNQRNPWQDFKPPQLNIAEMPVEAKNISINLDKGFFEIAKAIFEQQKEFIKTLGKEKKDDAAAEGKLADGQKVGTDDQRVGMDDQKVGTEDQQVGTDDQQVGVDDQRVGTDDQEFGDQASGSDAEQRAGEDRRKGGEDTRGEGAAERRSGHDRRDAAENTAPPPLEADGNAAPEESTPQAAKPAAEDNADGVMEKPELPQMGPDGQPMAESMGAGEGDEGGGEEKEEENKVQEIRGVLELKTPDQEDTPFLTLTYDFTKIPHAYRLAKDNGIFEYAYYKYKPMLVKAHQFIKRKQITRALNYYRVIREQQIPSEFRHMVDRNIKDITEYLQKYLVTRAN